MHDRNGGRLERLVAELGAAVVSLDDLARSGCRGAIVCSETVHHETDIVAALEAGLPVFTEKPIAGSATAARRCAEVSETRGVLLHTGYFFRTNGALRRLHGMLHEGTLGRVVEARMRFCHDGGYADWLDLDCWMTDPALACYGGFVDEGVHAIDTLQWLVGLIEKTHVITVNALSWPVDDHGAAVVSFAGGATGLVEAGWTDSAMRVELDIVGERGWARLRDGVLAVGERGESAPSTSIDLSPLDAGDGIEPFLDAIEGKDAAGLAPAPEAARVNELLDLMYLQLR